MTDGKHHNTMRICLFSRAPFLGGAEVACERLAMGLQQLGHEVLVVIHEKNSVYDRFKQSGIQTFVRRLPLRDKKAIIPYSWHWFRLLAFLKNQKPSIVHSNDLPTFQFTSSVTTLLKIPHICHHRFIYDGPCIDWLSQRRADLHIFVSQYLMDLLSENSLHLRSQPRHVVYDGLPIGDRVTEIDRINARRKLGITHDRQCVLFAGQVIERKGVRELIDAWEIVCSETKRADLIIAGDDIQNGGAYRTQMEAYALSKGVSVRFIGFQKNVAELLKAADIAVVPSREEPLGNATLEAMAMGIPVIGTRTGGIPEMILHEVTGLLVPVQAPLELAEAIRRLLTNPDLARTLGEAGRSRCESIFDLPIHIRAIVRIYEQLVSQKPEAQRKLIVAIER